MVSLKSFKLIVDGETDEDYQTNNISRPKGDHIYQHHKSDQQPTFYDASSATIDDKMSTRGKLEAMLNNDPLHMINNNTSESSVNQHDSNNHNNNNIKLKPTKMTRQNHQDNSLDKSSSESNIVNGPEDIPGTRKQDMSNKSVVKVSLNSLKSDDQKSALEFRSNTTTTTTTPTTTVVSPRSSPNENIERDSTKTAPPSSSSSSSISIVVVQHNNLSDQKQSASDSDYAQDVSSNQSLDDLDEADDSNQRQSGIPSPIIRVPVTTDESYYTVGVSKDVFGGNMHMYQKVVGSKGNGSGLGNGLMDSRFSTTLGSEHFEIVWSNLSYRIEPKWYKKINFLDRVFSHFLPGQTIDNHSSATSTASSSAGMNDNQHQMHTSANADSHLHNTLNLRQKSSLDPLEIFTNLNGTIKSGQMTAVLGPSGKYIFRLLIYLYFA